MTTGYRANQHKEGIALRSGNLEDAEVCGRICHDAFADIAAAHGFPKDFPSPEVAAGFLSGALSHPGFYAVVAEQNGHIVGSNILDERASIFGVGPITVDPSVQNAGIGAALMEDVLQRAAERGAAGVRLLQDAFHNRSFVLYTKLGFKMRVTTSVMQGGPIQYEAAGIRVRKALPEDLEACNKICRQVHGHDRGGELGEAIAQGGAIVVERDGRLTGYSTGVAFFGHSVAETNEDMKAMIGSVSEYGGPGFHVPNTNTELLHWCYENGLRMVKAMTLMTVGLYNEPQGPYLPSVLY
jgi:GNAT superfamily N-acetyltransferase